MLELILGSGLIIVTAILADKAAEKWKKMWWAVFVTLVVALTWAQINARRAEAKKAGEQETAIADTKGKLDKSLLSEEHMKGQLDVIGVMVHDIGKNKSDPAMSQLANALGVIARTNQQQLTDATLSKKELCRKAFDLAKRIRDIQAPYVTERDAISMARFNQPTPKTQEESNQRFQEEIQKEMTLHTAHSIAFQPYMSEARYLRDRLLETLQKEVGDKIRTKNQMADATINANMLAGASPEYEVAAYLEDMARTLCPK